MTSLALSHQFAQAGLSLVVEPRPLRGAMSAEIVQLDIARDPRERYRFFPGNTQTSRVDVTAADRQGRQVVLLIDEAVRTGRVRHFLCGQDEEHLFIAQLPREASSVRDAQDALAPEIPSEYDRGLVRRQGEWFFMPVTPSERGELNVLSPALIRAGGLAEVAQNPSSRPSAPGDPSVPSRRAPLRARSESGTRTTSLSPSGLAPRAREPRAVRANRPSREAHRPMDGLARHALVATVAQASRKAYGGSPSTASYW